MKRLILIMATAALVACGGGNSARRAATSATDIDNEGKYIALSFDDGPSSTTHRILDVMEHYGARGSFFVIGRNINTESAEAMKRAIAMGCEIQNHSFSHPHMSELTPDEQRQQIEQTTEAIVSATGTVPTLFRPPYIDYNEATHQATPMIFIGGYSPSDWDKNVTVEERIEKLMENATNGTIFLLHDFEGNEATAKALEQVIPALQSEGYIFVTVTELFALNGIMPKKGLIYDGATKARE